MKLTNNFTILPEKTSEIKKILSDAGIDDKNLKTVKITGISKISTATNPSLTDLVFNGLSVVHKKYGKYFQISTV